MTTETPIQEGYHLAPLSMVTPSTTNPRKRFNETELNELAQSIKEHGVMQPILTRPLPGFYGSMLEIVAGERRYRASKIAGVEFIPTITRQLTDTEALQLQILENLQRDGLHPLEEAQGFKQLLDHHDANAWNADILAEKIGKSRSYIYASLKLLSLCTYVQDQFLSDKIKREAALLIARIPGAKLQEQACKTIIERELSFRQAKAFLQQQFTVDLTQAKWDLKSETLYPDAGSCFSCKKRTGNYPEEHPDIESPDVCTDTACFAAKKVAYATVVIQTNPRAIHGEQVKEIAPAGVTQYFTKGYESSLDWIRVDGIKAKDILTADDIEPYIAVDEHGNTRECYKEDEVKKVLAEKIQEKLASGELVLEGKEPSEHEIKHAKRQQAKAEEQAHRLNVINRLIPHLNSDNRLVILRTAINFILDHIRAENEFFKLSGFADEESLRNHIDTTPQDESQLLKTLATYFLCSWADVGWSWEPADERDEDYEDEDWDNFTQFITNLGLDLAQLQTAELPLTRNPAAQAQETKPELEPTPDPASQDAELDPKKAAARENFKSIAEKELAKRARKAQRDAQKESANADA